MKKNCQSIEWVVNQLVQGQKHKLISQKSGVVAPAVTSPGRGSLYSLATQVHPMPGYPTSVPSVPLAKSRGSQPAGFKHILNQSLRNHSIHSDAPNLGRTGRSGSFHLPRSQGAATSSINSMSLNAMPDLDHGER